MDSWSANAELMKRYVEAVEKDWEAATAFWADDVLLHFPGRSPSRETSLARRLFSSATVGSPPSSVAP